MVVDNWNAFQSVLIMISSRITYRIERVKNIASCFSQRFWTLDRRNLQSCTKIFGILQKLCKIGIFRCNKKSPHFRRNSTQTKFFNFPERVLRCWKQLHFIKIDKRPKLLSLFAIEALRWLYLCFIFLYLWVATNRRNSQNERALVDPKTNVTSIVSFYNIRIRLKT